MIKILAIDDECSILNLLRISLTNTGFHCDIAENANSAIEKIHNNIYDIILLDIMLPEFDGFELLEYIKVFNIPVIFLTAKNDVFDRVKGLKMGGRRLYC